MTIYVDLFYQLSIIVQRHICRLNSNFASVQERDFIFQHDPYKLLSQTPSFHVPTTEDKQWSQYCNLLFEDYFSQKNE
jgi:hypothetical protein